MRPVTVLTISLPLAALLAGSVWAQPVVANYELTRPALGRAVDVDLVPRIGLFALGPVRVSASGADGAAGAGLALETGRQWFARVGVGRALDNDIYSVGGGYRWTDGQSVSMQLTHSPSEARTGLALRYDWPRLYLRFGYDTRPREGGSESLRFSAGMRF
jgi:hypothetical protein